MPLNSFLNRKRIARVATPEELAAPDPHPVTHSPAYIENSKWASRRDFVTMVTERYLDRLVETGTYEMREVCEIMAREARMRGLLFEGSFVLRHINTGGEEPYSFSADKLGSAPVL